MQQQYSNCYCNDRGVRHSTWCEVEDRDGGCLEEDRRSLGSGTTYMTVAVFLVLGSRLLSVHCKEAFVSLLKPSQEANKLQA